MRLDRHEEFQGGLVRQAALFVDGRIKIIPAKSETVAQLIGDVREAKFIDYPRLGTLLLEHLRVWFHPQVNAHWSSLLLVIRPAQQFTREAQGFGFQFRVSRSFG